MTADDRAERDERWRARHGDDVARVGDDAEPADVRRLYADMGELLEASYADDLDGVPQLSLPETIPAVTSLLAGARGTLLDAGCGPHPAASIALARAEPGRTLVGVDIGLGTVRLARGRAARDGVALLAVVADVERLPFRHGAFAGAVCDDTIEHVPDDGRAVRELARVVAPGAPLVIATPNRHSAFVLLARAADLLRRRRLPARAYFVAESHLREYTTAELRRLLRPVGTIDGHAVAGWSGGPKRALLTRAVALPGMRRLDCMLVVRVRPR